MNLERIEKEYVVTLDEFKATLGEARPPAECRPSLQAMWYDGKGDWEAAHDVAQDDHSKEGSWVHAYLHRKEGDLSNADYWYRRCGRNRPSSSLDEEWAFIVDGLLP